MPLPQTLEHTRGTARDESEIEAILRPSDSTERRHTLPWPTSLEELLQRIDRYRLFWLRTSAQDTDPQGRRIVTHPDWQRVYAALKELNLITVRQRQASGTRSDFVHFRQDISVIENDRLYRKLMATCPPENPHRDVGSA